MVLVTCFFPTLGLSHIGGGFGSAEKQRDIPIRDTCSDFGPFIYLTLPSFHFIKSGDTISSHFRGSGKKIAWAIHQDSLTNNHRASLLGILTCKSLNGLWLSCIVRDVFRLRSMTPGIVLQVVNTLWRTSNTLTQLCLNM